MKEKLKNKKVVYTIIGIVSVLLVALAVTYAYWLVTKTQTGENEITAGCLDIAISGEKNDIELTNQFPMSDEEGMKLVPYEFTVTNNCNTSVDYQVSLEATGDSSNALKGTSLKVALDDSYKLFSSCTEIDTTITDAYESRIIGYSRLTSSTNGESSKTHKLRIWIDKDAPISEMNKTFKSKISVTVGQGLENPYADGTLSHSILANAGGPEAALELSAEYKHEVISSTDRSLNPRTSYYYGTDFEFDETTMKYKLAGTLTQATLTECQEGTKTCGKYSMFSANSTYESVAIYEVTNWNSSKGTRYVTINTITANNAFMKVTDSNVSGLYKTQDDLGDSYYYRGNVKNNYVEFGTYVEDTTISVYDYNNYEEKNIKVTAGTPMYWRIVRINGDETIRLIYDGTTKNENGSSHISCVNRSRYNELGGAKSVGYTYDDGTGTQIDSDIKVMADEWYNAHLKNQYGKYIADTIFCNDRSEARYEYIDSDWNTTTDPNAAAYTNVFYGAYQRVAISKKPSLKCINKNDRYTVDDTTNGNGLLSNPIGLITADEEAFAGNVSIHTNPSYYLYNGSSYWTMSPYNWNDFMDEAYVWSGGNNMNMSLLGNNWHDVRPVINLKADVKFTGNGTIDDPYKIITE